MKIHKANNNAWADHQYYIMGSSTDSYTSLPVEVYPNSTTITATLKGNSEQNGTPTPSAPVPVVGVGDLETIGEYSGQYKIPILLNSQTINKYLGEVQTTRNVKKLVFDGTENTWQEYSSPQTQRLGATMPISDMKSNSRAYGFCTHFTPISTPSQNTVNGITFGDSNNFVYITFSVDTATALNLTDLTSIKAWLASEYSAGHPVTIWYILDSSTTGITNEPLMKIYTYADSLTTSIPVTAGENSIDVQTTVQPSEVSAGFSGWHPVPDPHKSQGGEWS